MGRITTRVRELRRNQTHAENLLWQVLRRKNLNGLKFKRQEPIFYQNAGLGRNNYFVADFYCPDHKLIVELDGEIHKHRRDYDQNRDSILRDLGYKVLRIGNEEMAMMEDVKRKILAFVK